MKGVYVFDMDGVLIDSMARFAEGNLKVLDKRGISYAPELIDIITPLGYEGTAKYIIETMGVQESIESIVKEIEKNLYFEYANTILLKDGVKPYLEKLAAKDARMFVLTASPHMMTDTCLKKNGIYDMFEQVWSVDEFDGLTKSNVELFKVVAEKIGCAPEEVHYFDDNIIAIENAATAKFNTYAVEDRQSQEVLQRLKSMADHYVYSFREMLV